MRFLVFQHLVVEHPGILRDYWREEGIEWDAIELDEGDQIPADLSPYSALVVMGGPMDVWQEELHPWLIPEKRAIRRWVDTTSRPLLGICLGHQLLADAMGGSVERSSRPEVGLGEVILTSAGQMDPLLAGMPNAPLCFQWHSAEVKSLPQGAIVLARNENSPIQAFRLGTNAYGFQYHVEITSDTVSDWGSIPEYKASLEQIFGAGSLPRLEADVSERLPALNAVARTLHRNFVELVKHPAEIRP